MHDHTLNILLGHGGYSSCHRKRQLGDVYSTKPASNISIVILKQFAEVQNELHGMRENMTAIIDSVYTRQCNGMQNQYHDLQNQYNRLQSQTQYTSTRSDVQDIERRQLQLHVDILRFQASCTDQTANLQLEIEELASRFPHEFHESLSNLND